MYESTTAGYLFYISYDKNIISYNTHMVYNKKGILEDIGKNKTIEICKEKCAAHAQELIDELNNL